jgi:hypothetical protein
MTSSDNQSHLVENFVGQPQKEKLWQPFFGVRIERLLTVWRLLNVWREYNREY